MTEHHAATWREPAALNPDFEEAVERHDSSVAKLIRYARETKIRWIIEGLWQDGGIALVHSLEGEFKSILSYQIGEAIAAGSSLLRNWDVPRSRKVGILETEMDDLEVGLRLGKMYSNGNWPDKLEVSNDALLKEFRRRTTLGEKLQCIDGWLREKGVEVLIWDTVNSALATGDPNSERSVSLFFDGIAQLRTKGILIVRHDVKPSRDSSLRASNQLVRGSNRLVEDASVVIHLHRRDKASNKVIMDVGKLRNGPKPEPIEIWFDAGTFRLTPLPPIAALLEEGFLSRQDLIEQSEKRFNLKERAVDNSRAQLGGCLDETKDGHRRILSLNHQFRPDPESEVAKWWKFLRQPGAPA
jgi:AAA domain